MDISYTLKKGIKYVQHYGVKELITRMHEKQDSQDISYEEFCKQEQISAKELAQQKKESKGWRKRPSISVICLSDNMPEMCSADLECSLQAQTYSKWELVVSSSLKEAVQVAKGQYLAFLEEGDTLEPQALYEVAKAILQKDGVRQSGLHWEELYGHPDLIYTDEDNGMEPQMKPDFSTVMLEELCYIRHFLVVAKSLAKEVVDQELDLDTFARACAARASFVHHIPKVLYHHVNGVEYENAVVDATEVEGAPLVSIIIPNKDERATLEQCLESIRRSTYPNYEIIIVENNSTTDEIFSYYETLTDAKVVTWKAESGFNYSAINNYGVSQANGSYLLFLNNDIEIITPDWIERLVADCQRPMTAIAGAKLYYPDDTIQHAGVMIGLGGHARGIAANMCIGQPRTDAGYMQRASIRQNMSAVTAACMMMERGAFEEVGGFTEELTVAFNDVDLCLKARKAGYEIVFDPYVEAYHYESKSRGQEDTPEKVRRFQSEIEHMRTKWEDILKEGDPYYNPNLSRYRMDYSLRRGK